TRRTLGAMPDLSDDLRILRQRLRLALACAPVVLAIPLGCTDGESRSTKQAEPAGKRGSLFGNNELPPDAPTTTIPEENFYPPCPSGKWCGTKALVEPLRTDAHSMPSPDVEGCPAMISGLDT